MFVDQAAVIEYYNRGDMHKKRNVNHFLNFIDILKH